MKKFLAMLMSVALIMTMSMPVFAAETPPSSDTITANLDEIDLSKPYSDTKVVYDDEGNPITMSLDYEPAPQTRGSSTNSAHAGTWTSKVSYGIWKMSYQFDLSKSGSQWKMSNARNHQYSGVFVTFGESSLTISRSVSTDTKPCEINGRVTATLFDNGWVQLYSGTWLLTTTVNKGGTMTTTWN